MRRQIAAGEDAAMHFRMQRLDAAVEHFREAGVVTDFGDGESGFAQQSGGAARRQEADAQGGESARKFEGAAFVGKADEGLTDFHGWRSLKFRAGLAPAWRRRVAGPVRFTCMRADAR